MDPCPSGEEGLRCFASHKMRSGAFELLLSALLLGALITALCKVMSAAHRVCGQPGWTLLFLPGRAVAGLGMNSEGCKAHVTTGCSLLCLRLCLFLGLAPFPVGCPLRCECNALLIQYSTKLKSWSWKNHMPNKQLCWQWADKPWTQGTRSRFPVCPHKALSGSGMLASYGTCSVVPWKCCQCLLCFFLLLVINPAGCNSDRSLAVCWNHCKCISGPYPSSAGEGSWGMAGAAQDVSSYSGSFIELL